MSKNRYNYTPVEALVVRDELETKIDFAGIKFERLDTVEQSEACITPQLMLEKNVFFTMGGHVFSYLLDGVAANMMIFRTKHGDTSGIAIDGLHRNARNVDQKLTTVGISCVLSSVDRN